MTRRPLLLLAAILLALLVAAFLLWLWVGLLRGLGGTSVPMGAQENRPLTAGADSGAGVYALSLPSTTQANRDFARPVLRASPDPAADRPAARATSPRASTHSVLRGVIDPQIARSVAAVPPAPSASAGEAGQEDSNYLALRRAIEWCESRLNPTVVNARSGASGIAQFLDSTWVAVTHLPPPAAAYPVAVQQRAFDALYKLAGGPSPWAASRGCWETQ